MKLPLLVFVLTSLAGNAQPFLFSEDFDMTGHQFGPSSNIITYDGGNMVATLSNTTNGQRYITLKKTDITGALQWDKRYGPGIDDFQNVVQSADSGYFFCYRNLGMSNQYTLVKLDVSGNIAFTRRYNIPVGFTINYAPQSIARTNGGYYVSADLVNSPGYRMWHLFKLDVWGQLASAMDNPARDILHVQSTATIIRVDIYNSPGQLIASSTCNDVQCDFDTGNLPPGSYLVRITDEQEVTTRRIVIAD